MADPAPDLAAVDPAVAALRTIQQANRRDRIVTFAGLVLILFLTWRTGVRADELVDAVGVQAESNRIGTIVDCRETDFERSQGLLIIALVERQPPEVVTALIVDYRRYAELLEAPVTEAEADRCSDRYGRTDDDPPPPLAD